MLSLLSCGHSLHFRWHFYRVSLVSVCVANGEMKMYPCHFYQNQRLCCCYSEVEEGEGQSPIEARRSYFSYSRVVCINCGIPSQKQVCYFSKSSCTERFKNRL